MLTVSIYQGLRSLRDTIIILAGVLSFVLDSQRKCFCLVHINNRLDFVGYFKCVFQNIQWNLYGRKAFGPMLRML